MSMRRGSRNKRTSATRHADRSVFSLMVHGPEFGSELVINPDCFPDVKVNDLLEIVQPEREHQRLVLQVTSLAPVKGKLQISVLKDIAAQFGLDIFYNVVIVQRVDPRDVTLDFLELSFKDQFLSRADIWRFKVAMLGKCVHVSKNVETLGIRAQVEGLFANQQDVLCGVVGPDTKIIVRSRSGRLFWLVQMSTEMWEFAPDGELYYEKLLNRLLGVLVNKWIDNSVTHSVTIIAFSRSFYDKEQFPDDYDPKSTLFASPTRQGFGPGCTANHCANGYGPTIHVDPLTGQYYEDFYKVLVMNYTGPDWSELLLILKREFMNYHETHRWRLPSEPIPCEYEVCRHTEAISSSSAASPLTPSDTQPSTQTTSYVKWKVLPFGVPSRAADGNVLEAINVTLNILDKHYMDRDLNRTGQSIVMLTAGSSVFKVDERLAEITKQRMMDNGVGMDMISLATPPLHVAPLFICRHRGSLENEDIGTRTIDSIGQLSASATPTGLDGVLTPTYSAVSESMVNDDGVDESALRVNYIIPHWVNITFVDFDCQCDATSLRHPRQSSPNQFVSHGIESCPCQAQLNKRFLPLPPFRMFDMTATSEKLPFPVSLRSMMEKSSVLKETKSLVCQKTPLSPECFVQRKLSGFSDTISSGSPVMTRSQWHLTASPNLTFVVPMHSKLSSSLLARQVFQEYDADVFSLSKMKSSAWKSPKQISSSSTPMCSPARNVFDFASATLTGDMIPLDLRNGGRWKSASMHGPMHAGQVGSSSVVSSILSPRNEAALQKSKLPLPPPRKPRVAETFKSPIPTKSVKIKSGHEELRANHSFQPASIGNDRTSEAHATDDDFTYSTPVSSPVRGRTRSISEAGADVLAVATPLGRSVDSLSKRDGERNDAIMEDSTHVDMHDGHQVSRSLSASRASPRIRPSFGQYRSPPPPLHTGSFSRIPSSPFNLSSSLQRGLFGAPSMRRNHSDHVLLTTAPTTPSILVPPTPGTGGVSAVNPFKYSGDTMESTTARLTSDRRRWSHLFPTHDVQPVAGKSPSNETATQVFVGPNWKSLTSPAILPLTTDYYPPPKDLHTSYTESFYSLTLPSRDMLLFPRYNSHEELLIEMVCQRLASDFQLVSSSDPSAHDSESRLSKGINPVPSRLLGLGAGEDERQKTTYYLSMGHRIHQIIYDPEMEAIEVKRYLERASQGEHNEPKVYTYSLWVEKTKSFHPLQQKFYQYPMPEDNWNSLDHLLCGYHDEMTDYTKCRRIRFAIVPPISVVSGSKADKETYVSQRFMRFVDYLQSRIVSDDQEKIEIKIAGHNANQTKPERFKRCGVNSYKVCCSSLATFSRLKSGDTRREWVMMQLEDTVDVQRNYHFDVRWLACSGIIVDDFIATLKRKAKQAGLELRRVPEYARISFLQIHPLVAPIYFPMPLALTHKVETEKSLMDDLINRLGFVLDDERVADAVGIGYGLGLGQDERPLTASGYRCWASRLRNNVKGSPPQRSSASESRAVDSVCKRGYVQVMHRQAPVFLRLIHNGLVWIPSYDYDQLSNPEQVQALFMDVVQLVQTISSVHELTTTCCGSEAA